MYGNLPVLRARILVWLCLLEAGLVNLRGQFQVNNQSQCCYTARWLNNGCYPYYGNVVVAGTGCGGTSTFGSGPPCQGSVLSMDFGGCTPTVYLNNFMGGTINVGADGTVTTNSYSPPNNYSGSVTNPTTSTQIIGLTSNGVPVGSYLIVPPGGGGSLPWQDQPGSGTVWGWELIPGGSVSGPSTGEPGGVILITNGVYVPPLIGGPLGPPNSDNPLLTNFFGGTVQTNWQISGTNSGSIPTPAPPVSTTPPVPPYTNSPDSNAPVSYNGTTNLQPLTAGVFEQGINSLYTEESTDTRAIVAAIQQFNSDFNYAVIPITNGLGAITNWLDHIDTNAGNIASNTAALNSNFTNVFNTNFAFNSNAAVLLAASASAQGADALQQLGAAVSLNANVSAGSPGWTVAILGTTYNLDPLANPTVAEAAAWIRTLSQWSMYGWFLFWLYNEIAVVIRDAGRAPQGTAADDVPGVSSGVALTMAALVTAAITILILACVAYVTDNFIQSFLNHPFASAGAGVVQGGLYLLNGAFDIGLCVSLMAYRLAVQMYLTKAYFICVTAVRFLTG